MTIDQDEITIDESTHRPAPTFWQRIKHVAISIVMAVVLAQVMLFAFWKGSIVIYINFYPKLVVAYLLICAILGWFYGDKFIQTLGKKSAGWWNLWGEWN